jgi:hypothetical protein
LSPTGAFFVKCTEPPEKLRAARMINRMRLIPASFSGYSRQNIFISRQRVQ